MKKFVIVTSKKAKTLHYAVTRSEGLTLCGRQVVLKEWHWWNLRSSAPKKPLCSMCEEQAKL